MIDNFTPVIKLHHDKENEADDNEKRRECRGCKKKKAIREFYRGQWTSDPERGTYRRTCRVCRGLLLRQPPVVQATTAELALSEEKDGSALLGTLSRQVFRDLTNDPSRLIRERIFENLRFSSLYEYDCVQQFPCPHDSDILEADRPAQKEDNPKHDLRNEREEPPWPERPASSHINGLPTSGAQLGASGMTGKRENLLKFEQLSVKLRSSTFTLAPLQAPPDSQRPGSDPRGLAASESSPQIPRRLRVRSVP